MTFEQTLTEFDQQLYMLWNPVRERYVIYRMPEKYGRPRNRDFSSTLRLLSAGMVYEIMALQDNSGHPIPPGSWVLNYLRERDTRRIGFNDWVQEMDERNERLKKRAQEDASDRLKYRISEDWSHIRDELRGDNKVFRKYTQNFDKSWEK